MLFTRPDRNRTRHLFYGDNHPDIGIVIPVKNSGDSIRACVNSLLLQDYPGKIHIVVVGDPEDTSWGALGDYITAGKITAIEVDVISERRDSNAKRSVGLKHLNDLQVAIMALTDSDMLLPRNWANEAANIVRKGWECAGGPMAALGTGFWSTYVDKNPLLPKTPRMPKDYVVTADNIGVEATPPITAAAILTRDVYRKVGGPDMNMVQSYEDYAFFDAIVQAGFTILCTPRLVGWHGHREQFRALLKDYVRTGAGCADFVHYNAKSPMAHQRKRCVSALGGILAATPIVGVTALAVVPSGMAWLGMFMAIIYLALGTYCVRRTKRWISFAFPCVTTVFCLASWYGYIQRLRRTNRYGRPETVIVSIDFVAQERSLV